MISRAWHGVTPVAKADEYLEYLQRTGVPDYRRTEGNRGVYVLRSIAGEQAHVLLISLWDSYDTIRAFAGHDIAKARYYPEDSAYLLEMQPTVTHYEVLVEP